jgi:hypothetical protein
MSLPLQIRAIGQPRLASPGSEHNPGGKTHRAANGAKKGRKIR